MKGRPVSQVMRSWSPRFFKWSLAVLMKTTPPAKRKKTTALGAQRRIAKEGGKHVPLARQVNLVAEEMDRFITAWCLETEQWFDANHKEIEKEHAAGGGVTGMTGKACLIRSMRVGANRLLQLADALDNR